MHISLIDLFLKCLGPTHVFTSKSHIIGCFVQVFLLILFILHEIEVIIHLVWVYHYAAHVAE